MKRVLITGAAGFIGSHLAEACVEQGHDVTAFVRYNSRGSAGWLDESQHRDSIRVLAGDIRDGSAIDEAVRGMDLVFHLAALIGIPYSYICPEAYVRTNIDGTLNVLQAARRYEVARVVVTSTSETYGTAQYVPIDEKHPAVGQSPYAATKIAADQLALSFHRSFGLPVRIARPFNTYGPRQSVRAFIPAVITQLLAGTRELQLGNLAPTRDLTFVTDTSRALIAIAEAANLDGEVLNIGMHHEISMEALARRIGALAGLPVEFATEAARVRPSGSEVERLFCDNRALLTKTAWRPRYDLDQGLKETFEWFKGRAASRRPLVYQV
jgi:NAD dependent epimerase/dehydratase